MGTDNSLYCKDCKRRIVIARNGRLIRGGIYLDQANAFLAIHAEHHLIYAADDDWPRIQDCKEAMVDVDFLKEVEDQGNRRNNWPDPPENVLTRSVVQKAIQDEPDIDWEIIHLLYDMLVQPVREEQIKTMVHGIVKNVKRHIAHRLNLSVNP